MNNSLVLFGGVGRTKMNDLTGYSLLSKTWVQYSPHNPPPSLLGHSLLAFGNTLVLYGGTRLKSGRKCSKKLYQLANDEWQLLQASGIPPTARRNHAVCGIGSSMLVFGGTDSSVKNDLHVLDLAQQRWANFPDLKEAPSARSHATLTPVLGP